MNFRQSAIPELIRSRHERPRGEPGGISGEAQNQVQPEKCLPAALGPTRDQLGRSVAGMLH